MPLSFAIPPIESPSQKRLLRTSIRQNPKSWLKLPCSKWIAICCGSLESCHPPTQRFPSQEAHHPRPEGRPAIRRHCETFLISIAAASLSPFHLPRRSFWQAVTWPNWSRTRASERQTESLLQSASAPRYRSHPEAFSRRLLAPQALQSLISNS